MASAAIRGEDGEADRIVGKVAWRLLPIMGLLYLVAYVDRTNIGFAALTMNQDLGISATVFGWAAGIFFLGYMIFEVPSNIIMEKVGARWWIARIMISWGIVAGAMMFASGPISLTILRFLLGVAEAGFFPGMILYLTYWFPLRYRSRYVAIFAIAMPLSSVVGSPISGLLLQMHGFMGLVGWQWLFLIEAIPAVLLGLLVLRILPDGPKDATFLEPAEREWLERELESERHQVRSSHGKLGIGKVMVDWRVWVLIAIYFGQNIASYGLSFFMPQIVKSMGLSTVATGFVAAIPYAIAIFAMVLVGRSVDRTGDRRFHGLAVMTTVAAGVMIAAYFGTSLWSVVGLILGAGAIYSIQPCFWPLPSEFLTDTDRAAGIATINSVGNLGGFLGPYMIGYLHDQTGTYSSGLVFVGITAFVAGLILFSFARPALRVQDRLAAAE